MIVAFKKRWNYDGISISEQPRQIQKDHGIRSDHINLTFFGHPLRDDMSISDQGVAAGG